MTPQCARSLIGPPTVSPSFDRVIFYERESLLLSFPELPNGRQGNRFFTRFDHRPLYPHHASHVAHLVPHLVPYFDSHLTPRFLSSSSLPFSFWSSSCSSSCSSPFLLSLLYFLFSYLACRLAFHFAHHFVPPFAPHHAHPIVPHISANLCFSSIPLSCSSSCLFILLLI